MATGEHLQRRDGKAEQPVKGRTDKRTVATSPYVATQGRLGDVIAAIQAMGAYKFYKLDFAGWADRISADKSLGDHWQHVFEEHPEFFRLDGARQRASLVWRRQNPKLYHVDRQCLLSKDEFVRLAAGEKARVSRAPLSADDIRTLVGTAIDLHQRALEERRERRWWLPLASAAGGLIGSIAGALIGALLKTAGK